MTNTIIKRSPGKVERGMVWGIRKWAVGVEKRNPGAGAQRG